MKKTLLSILAMLVMGVSGAWAENVGESDCSTGWWGAHSSYYTMTPNQKAHITFTNHSSKANNWNNWVLAVTSDAERNAAGYEEYTLLRADAYGWGTYYTDLNLTKDFEVNDTFKDDMDGAAVDMYITFDNGRINMTATMTSTAGKVLNYSYKSLFVPTKEKYRFFFSVDGSYLENLTATIEDYTSPMKAVSTASEELIGKEDNTTVAWSASSKTYSVKKNQYVVAKFKNYTDKAANWDSWNLVMPDYMTIRNDAYGWGADGKTTAEKYDSLCTVFKNNFNWDTYLADMNESDVEMKFIADGNRIYESAFITTSGGTTYHYDFVSTVKEGMEGYTFYFSPEKAHMTNLSVTTYGVPYTVTYNNNGHGTAPDAIETDYLPDPLPTMTEEGWTFDGWFTDEALTTAAVAGANVTAATTLYAKWTQVASVTSLKVNYKYNDETIYTDEMDVTGLKVGDSKVVPFRAYIQKDGALYSTTANTSGNYYGDTQTLAAENSYDKALTLVDLKGGTLQFFTDLDDSDGNNAGVRASYCSAYDNKEYTSKENIPAGDYTVMVRCMNKGRESSIQFGDATVAVSDLSNKNSWATGTKDITVTTEGPVTLVKGTSAYDLYDVIIVIKKAATAINSVDAVKAADNKVIKTAYGIVKNGKKYNFAGQQMK